MHAMIELNALLRARFEVSQEESKAAQRITHAMAKMMSAPPIQDRADSILDFQRLHPSFLTNTRTLLRAEQWLINIEFGGSSYTTGDLGRYCEDSTQRCCQDLVAVYGGQVGEADCMNGILGWILCEVLLTNSST